MCTLRATSSHITAAFTAAFGSLPMVKGPWLRMRTAGERCPESVSTMPLPMSSLPISANGPTGISPPNSSAIIVSTHGMGSARAEPIPCVLTMMADEFGGEIPVGPFALIGNDDIGKGIVETLSGHRSPAVLMRNHGPFTIGKDPKAAVKAAVMCEDVARSVHVSRQLGDPVPIGQDDVDYLYDRYQNVYGQRPDISDDVSPD